MNDADVCREILTTAVERVGGVDSLAKILRRNQEEVQAWLDGTQSAPMNVYFEACLLLSQFRWASLWTSRTSPEMPRDSGIERRPLSDRTAIEESVKQRF